MSKRPLGVDVSKSTLDHYTKNSQQEEILGVVENTVDSIQEFLSVYDPQEFFIIAEPTGTYSDKLFQQAYQMGFEVRLVNPKTCSLYTEALGILHKTDIVAAKVLFDMGKNDSLNIPVFTPQSQVLQERKQLQMALDALSKQARMLKNQIHAMEQRAVIAEVALEALQTTLATVETQKKVLETQLGQLTDDQIKEFNKYASSVVGIGPKTCNLLMIYTNGLSYFDNKNQLPKFVGTVPYSHQSGTSVNKKGSITKAGPGTLRACLYSAAKSAKRFNHACKAIYERLRSNGKAHKVAMIAVINKLLHQVFAVVKNQTLFDNELYIKNNA